MLKSMRRGLVKYNDVTAGVLTEEDNGDYLFAYDLEYVKNFPE